MFYWQDNIIRVFTLLLFVHWHVINCKARLDSVHRTIQLWLLIIRTDNCYLRGKHAAHHKTTSPRDAYKLSLSRTSTSRLAEHSGRRSSLIWFQTTNSPHREIWFFFSKKRKSFFLIHTSYEDDFPFFFGCDECDDAAPLGCEFDAPLGCDGAPLRGGIRSFSLSRPLASSKLPISLLIAAKNDKREHNSLKSHYIVVCCWTTIFVTKNNNNQWHDESYFFLPKTSLYMCVNWQPQLTKHQSIDRYRCHHMMMCDIAAACKVCVSRRLIDKPGSE